MSNGNGSVKTVQDEMREANERLHALVAQATQDDRDFSDEEKQEKDSLVARMSALDQKRKRNEGFDDLLRHVGTLAPPTPRAASKPPSNGDVRAYDALAMPAVIKALGAQFVETEVYASLRAMPKMGIWSTRSVELQGAVTLNPPGVLVPPGTSILPFLPYPADWGVAALFSQGTLDGGMVQYLQETAWTNAAAPVAVGGVKPESAKTFELKQQGLVKLAHFIQCPDEFLDDVAGLRSLIDAQMANGIVEKLNDQLINGDGTGGDMLGLIALPGKVPNIVADTGPGGGAVAVAAQRAAVYAASRLQPDAVVMHPGTWVGVSSQMTTAGGYLAGPGTFGAGVPPSVWGLRVVETPEIPAGTAIVGAFRQAAQLYSKGGVNVQATNSHADNFQKNITAIRAEIRAALVVYRPTGFGLVTGLPAPTLGGA